MPADDQKTLCPIHASPEMKALSRFFRDVTWTGVIEPGASGLDSPRMTAIGDGVHHEIQEGSWIVGDYEQTQYLPGGDAVLLWQMHLVCGWSPGAECYLATTADNFGRALLMRGKIEGDVLSFETDFENMRYRLSWDASAPEAIIWRNETSRDGQGWTLVESYACVPA